MQKLPIMRFMLKLQIRRSIRLSLRSGRSMQSDAFQGHWHQAPPVVGSNYASPNDNPSAGHDANGATGKVFAQMAVSDTMHGLVHISSETRPKNASVYWLIKVDNR